MERTYICIDLKSFYASVECVDRGLDALKTNLVVANEKKGKGAICLAVSPSLKSLGVRNRCRLFEIPNKLDYIIAMPRMKRYMEVSSDIYAVYLKYVSKDDIHVYSIDECFIDLTDYLMMYNKDIFEISKMILDDVYNTTKITASVGIGTNLFLAKVALDITAKKSKDHIGYLNEELFKKEIWKHRPITDIWNISTGIANRLAKYNVYDLYGITLLDKKVMMKEFGINSELIIDHANGIEPCMISDIKNYKSKNNSLSNGQILDEDYKYKDALLAMKEMVDLISLELVEKGLCTNHISLYIGYTKDIIKRTSVSVKLKEYTNSRKKLMEYFIELFERNVNKDYLIRRINIGLGNVKEESNKTISLFDDEEEEKKEESIQKTILKIKEKYGKNSILRGMNLEEKATTISRNKLIGGHNSGEYD